MIRINLLGVERPKQHKAGITFDFGRHVTLACGVIMVSSVIGIGWWYWSLTQASAHVDQEIATAQREAARLRAVLADVERFEATRKQLQQRVSLIEQLRSGQTVPVQLLDHVSRSLPDSLWLTQMDQTASGVTIEGLSTTLIAVSDFVRNLGLSPLLKKPIEIVNTEVQANQGGPSAQPGVEVIKFAIKAQMGTTSAAVPTKAAAERPR
jgi:type IV pilus assembly protein PilN